MATKQNKDLANQGQLLSHAKTRMLAVTNDDLITPNFHAEDFNPQPSLSSMKEYYVGKSLQDVPAPAVILDRNVIQKNCNTQLNAAKSLDLSFRAHVKTHKTLEISRMQVGEKSMDIRLIVSTVAELEMLLPWLVERRQAGAEVNVIYGIPFGPSVLPRLAEATRKLGDGSISLIVDHSDHIPLLEELPTNLWPGKILVFPKIDVGYQRAGIVSGSVQMKRMVDAIAKSERVQLHGFYAHQGSSYSASEPSEALNFFKDELNTLRAGADEFLDQLRNAGNTAYKTADLTLTLGATPTATAIQNLTDKNGDNIKTDDKSAQLARDAIVNAKAAYQVEVHAGVYCVLDMQQVATQVRPTDGNEGGSTGLKPSDLALQLMAEVISVYDDREKPEALIGAGSIALGREPCKSYAGWGVVSGWSTFQQDGSIQRQDQLFFPPLTEHSSGWKVDRISQEHGVLGWHGSVDTFHQLSIGERVLLWPNHACMCGPNFPFYLIVDENYRVVDVWLRCRGW